MADRRIKYPNDKADFIKSLIKDEDNKDGIFGLIVEVLCFAAALGAKNKKDIEVKDPSKSVIRYEIFERQGYDALFNLLAMYKTKDPNVLADNGKMESLRATIFEEYANGGLEIMREEIKGSVDKLNSLMLIMNKEREPVETEKAEFDISKLMD